jgi:hypothetical protein
MAAEPIGNWWDVEPEYEEEEARRARRQDRAAGKRGLVGRFSALLGLSGAAPAGRLLDIPLDDPDATGELPVRTSAGAATDVAALQEALSTQLAELRTTLEGRMTSLDDRVGELAKEARRRDRRTAAQLLYAELRSFERALRKAGHGEGAVFHQVQRVNDFIRWIEGEWQPKPLDEGRPAPARKGVGLRDPLGRTRT